jgi:hypothetical protein
MGEQRGKEEVEVETLKHVSMFQRNNSNFFLQFEQDGDRIRSKSNKRS